MSDSSIVRSSIWVGAGTALSRATGLIRVAALTYAVGQTKLGDVYTFANFAPNLVFELVIGGALSATLVPVFVQARDEHDDDAVSSIFSVGLLAALGLTLVAFGLAVGANQWLSSNIGSGPKAADDRLLLRVSIGMLLLMLPQILFYAVSTLSTAYLNALRRYRSAAFAPVLTNLVTIAAFVAAGVQLQGERRVLDVAEFRLAPILWLGLGTTGGIAVMVVPVLIAIRQTGTNIRFRPSLKHPAIRKVTRLSLWTFGYVAANQVALLVVYLIALRSGTGVAKRYSDAFIFFQLPHGLIAVSVMTTLTPELASAAGRLDFQGLADRFAAGLRLMAVLIIPAATGYLLLGTPIASMLFERGKNFSASDAEFTGHTIAAFAVGLPAFSTYLFANRGFYALSDTRTPFYINLIENGVNIVGAVGLVLVGAGSSVALALVYGISYLVAAAIALFRFDRTLRKLDPKIVRPDLTPILRMVVAAAAMLAAVFLVRLALPADHGVGAWGSVSVSVLAGAVVYVVAGHLLAIDEVQSATAALRRSIRRRDN